MFEWTLEMPETFAVGGPELLPDDVHLNGPDGQQDQGFRVLNFQVPGAPMVRRSFVLVGDGAANLVLALQGGVQPASPADLRSLDRLLGRDGGGSNRTQRRQAARHH